MALSAVQRHIEIINRVENWSRFERGTEGFTKLAGHLLDIIIEVLKEEPAEFETVFSVAEAFSAVRTTALDVSFFMLAEAWYPNAHLGLIAIADSLSMLLEMTCTQSDSDEDGAPLSEPIGWGNALIQGDRQQLVNRVEARRHLFVRIIDEQSLRALSKEVGRLKAEAEIELARAKISSVERIKPILRASHEDNEARALALLLKHPDWSNAQIARELGIHRSNLSSYQKFKAAREVQKSDRDRFARGYRSGPNRIEAWKDDADTKK